MRPKGPVRLCTVGGCEGVHYGKGLCRRHYAQQYKRPDHPPEWKSLPPEVRFWQKVDRSGVCWIWKDKPGSRGYGFFSVGGKSVTAHRKSWELTFGPIPEGQCVLHNCPGGDNRMCVNPAHLWLGTDLDNIADRNAKGRTARGARSGPALHPERYPRGDNHPKRRGIGVARGEGIGSAKLTEADVLTIRALYGPEWTYSALGKRFNVNKSTIMQVVRRRKWKHI